MQGAGYGVEPCILPSMLWSLVTMGDGGGQGGQGHVYIALCTRALSLGGAMRATTTKVDVAHAQRSVSVAGAHGTTRHARGPPGLVHPGGRCQVLWHADVGQMPCPCPCHAHAHAHAHAVLMPHVDTPC